VQILHPFAGSIQEYAEEIADPNRYRPDHCPQCQAAQGLTAHGFYRRTLVDAGFDGWIRVRRYLCRPCRRTVSLLPRFALPYLRFSVMVIALFLMARLQVGHTLVAAAALAGLPSMPYQRGQFWVRRFQRQAKALCAALVAWTTPAAASSFVLFHDACPLANTVELFAVWRGRIAYAWQVSPAIARKSRISKPDAPKSNNNWVCVGDKAVPST